ncbi:unnamed protein product [Peniophora sp. CBMAI 1063]|nr:unnamed protein product [Peniophora sp. CBMAI 1063]
MSYHLESSYLPNQPTLQQHFENVFQTWTAQLANVDCIQAVLDERRQRLFPEWSSGIHTPLNGDVYWIDLPPEFLRHGELNLVHEPSIFDSELYIPWLDVIAQLVFAHYHDVLMSHLRDQGVSRQCIEEPSNNLRLRNTLYQRILAQAARAGIPVGQCAAFYEPRSYPRSIFTSPRRNSGVLFCTGRGNSALNTLFEDATQGKCYFMSQLCRLPVDPSQCQPLAQANYEPISFRATYCGVVQALNWEGLETGDTRTWCMAMTLYVSSARTNLALSDIAHITKDSKWHAHCAPEDCCWHHLDHAGGRPSTQTLSVKAYHSALANHHGSKLPPPPRPVAVQSAHIPQSEREYHQSLVQYCRRFV